MSFCTFEDLKVGSEFQCDKTSHRYIKKDKKNAKSLEDSLVCAKDVVVKFEKDHRVVMQSLQDVKSLQGVI